MTSIRHMRYTTCYECDSAATIFRRNYRFDQLGIPVELRNIDVINCPNCGDTPVIPNMNELMDTLAVAVLCRPCPLRGAEVRFLRKYANKSAREFAEYLRIDHTSLSKIENESRKVSAQLDQLVRLTVSGMQEHLRGKIDELVELMPSKCPEEKTEIQIDPAKGTYQYQHAY